MAPSRMEMLFANVHGKTGNKSCEVAFGLIGLDGAIFCSPCDEGRDGNGKTREVSIM